MKGKYIMSMNFNELMMKVPKHSIFKMEGYLVWCGTITKDDDGVYYLFFSRWPKEQGHYAWVTHSEVAYAVSDNPLGPFEYKGVVLSGSGGDNWDATTIHNPTVIKVDGKYYMYYMGTKGKGTFEGKPSMNDLNWWEYRNNQRVGVAVAEHPAGPWTRFDKPCIDVTPGSFDQLATNNPTAAQGSDGKIYLVYKAIGDGPKPRGGNVICGVAIADNPLGPFVKQPEPIMVNPEEGWSVEDPFIWYQGDRFYALVKDFQGYFTKRGKHTVALFEAKDGINWVSSEYSFAFDKEFMWEDGTIQKLDALERPQLFIEDGIPKVLCCAAAIEEDKFRENSFNVQIPLSKEVHRSTDNR